MAGLETTIPLVVVGIIAILVLVFIIKSLIKFAFVAAVIALIVFVAWKLGAFKFLAQYVPSWMPFLGG
jgi:hypothetical protein